MIQLILLSGGSGKRLWPLSNDARSKQFLRLLKAPNGAYESMMQRVVRQIKEVCLDCEITIATNQSQKDSIENQLGDTVRTVLEPQRRDTFPAIALSSTYLKLAKGCSDNDVVVVMPCDPYTENSYFETIGKMAECVKKNVADLVLMGIKPTYPSEKYGYVVPAEKKEGYEIVEHFTEKPNIETAQTLLQQGAYWNGGVFAFRLGYLMSIVNRHSQVASFEEMVARYTELPKISFDYEVAEKAQSVAVVAYEGSWKDLGTWNTLSEELSDSVIGNAILGEKVKNTNVVNELSIPIFCDGINDAIVAASPDGIIVSAKSTSENIKHNVEKLVSRPMFEERRWGKYTVMGHSEYSDGYKSLTKNLFIFAGKNISYQLHNHRTEVWTFVDGEGLLVIDGRVTHVKRGDVAYIKQGQKHAIKAISDLQMIEVQTGDMLEESDIERFDWNWEIVE